MAKRGRKPKERKGYFYEREEQAIVDYTNAESDEERNKIFNTILLPALTKMIESIIRRYKLFVPDEEFPHTFNDTISYLLTKISNFKPEMYVYDEIDRVPENEAPVELTKKEFIELKKNTSETSPKYVRVLTDSKLIDDDIPDDYDECELENGMQYRSYKLEFKRYKAYSYCGTVCKNYLIYKNIQYTKNKQRNLPYDDMLDDFTRDPKYTTYGGEEDNGLITRLIKNISDEIKGMLVEKEKNELTDDEVKVGIALSELLDNWEELLSVDGSNKLQKSSVLYFLREETMMSTKEVRENMKKFRSAYFVLKKGMIESE